MTDWLPRTLGDISSVDRRPFIHPKAHVEDAIIGAGTKVWQFATVIRGTVLGEDCTVAAGACLDGPKLGDRCIVSPGVDIGPGFDIGDDVFLGPGVVLCNDAWPRTHKTGWDVEALRNGDAVCVRILQGASLGAHVVVLPGVTIGRYAMIAAGSVVSRDVPGGMLHKRCGEIVPIVGEPRRMKVAP